MRDVNEIKSTRTKFCHYTSSDVAKKIVSGKRIFLNSFENMNDETESEIHNELHGRAFSVCFCHSESKNIPMFYLYGGIDGKGCRIELTPSKMRNLVENLRVYPVQDNHCMEEPIDVPYKVYADWIHYYSQDGHQMYRRKELRGNETLQGILDTNRGNHEVSLFIKNYIWRYEDEFRIAIVFDEEIQYSRVAIGLPIEKGDRGISFTLGPEVTSEEFQRIKKELSENHGIQNVKPFSDEHIKIHMGLTNRYLNSRKDDR